MMRSTLGLLLATLSHGIFAFATASELAQAFIYDSDRASRPTIEHPTLPADTARLVLAQRLGLSSFHALGSSSEEVLGHVNQYAAPQERLFGGGGSTMTPRAIVIVEDSNQLEGVDATLASFPSFHIANPPSPSSNAAFLQHLIDQARSTDCGPLPSSNAVRYLEHDDLSEGLPDSDRYFLHRKSTHDIAHLLSTLRSKSASLTLIFMPASNSSNTNSWGTYSSPSECYLQSSQPKPHMYGKRQGDELLEAEAENFQSASSIGSASSSAPISTIPPAGILPAYFPNEGACNKTTNHCAGHGTCKLKYTNSDQQGSQKDCYACLCANDVTENEGKSKTIVWGGPACQKRDVSTGFWLLAGFTVAMVSVVAWGIGLLVSMGNEELPSVIGAGVSGPGARGK